MARVLSTHWWALALRGIFGIIFGLLAFFTPGITLYVLTILFGAYSLLDGIVSLVAAGRSSSHGEHWWGLLFEGVAGLAAAAVTVIWPAITLVVLIYIIAGWAIVTGIFEVITAIRLRKHVSGEWLLIITGVASILFGAILFSAPGAGAIVLAWWIGAYAFVFGILMVALSFRLRKWSATAPLQTA